MTDVRTNVEPDAYMRMRERACMCKITHVDTRDYVYEDVRRPKSEIAKQVSLLTRSVSGITGSTIEKTDIQAMKPQRCTSTLQHSTCGEHLLLGCLEFRCDLIRPAKYSFAKAAHKHMHS